MIGAAILLSAGLLASQLRPPSYALQPLGDGAVARLDTRTGEVIACGSPGCVGMIQPGRPFIGAALPGHPKAADTELSP